MLRDAAKRIIEAKKTGEDIFEDGGLPTLFTTPEQRETLNQISGMMSLLEGHGDVTMDRAGAGHVTNADVFAKTFRARRNSAKGFTRIFQKIAGFEAKLNQYQAGENFIEEVEAAGGTELLDRAWENRRIFLTLTRSNLQRHGSIESIINKLLAFLTKILKDVHCDQ